jgi:hypothetical protein
VGFIAYLHCLMAEMPFRCKRVFPREEKCLLDLPRLSFTMMVMWGTPSSLYHLQIPLQRTPASRHSKPRFLGGGVEGSPPPYAVVPALAAPSALAVQITVDVTLWSGLARPSCPFSPLLPLSRTDYDSKPQHFNLKGALYTVSLFVNWG